MEVAAHAGEVGDDVDAQGAELVGRADAGGEEQPRGADGAAGEDDLAVRVGRLGPTAALVLDAHASIALEDQAARVDSVRIVRFGCSRTAPRYARAVLLRVPSLMTYCIPEIPSWDSPL